MTAPPPLECHPAYLSIAEALRTWLDGPGVYLNVPFSRSLGPAFQPQELEPEWPSRDLLDGHVFTKRKVRGLAPYVGRPFVYEWRFATDELDRAVAGEARIVYDEGWLG